MSNAFIYNLTDTWNDGSTTFNALKINVTDTASAADSNLFDFQIDGVSVGSLGKDGFFRAGADTIGRTIADDYTALKAITGGGEGVNTVLVTDRSRGGEFYWRSGDRSSLVSSDPQEGIFVPPASDVTGASGCWERVTNGAEVWVDWFGADRSGATESQVQIQAAIDFILSTNNGLQRRGGTVRFASGTYLVTDTITMDTNDIIATGLVLQGSGNPRRGNSTRCTRILARFNAGPVMFLNDSDITIKDMHIDGDGFTRSSASSSTITTGAGNVNCGIEVSHNTFSANELLGVRQHITIQNVHITNQPADGVYMYGEQVSHIIDRVSVSNVGRHGFAIDSGLAGEVYGTHASPGTTSAVVSSTSNGNGYSKRPGLINFLMCRASDCGGHGFAIGHPEQGFRSPYRIQLDNTETFRCGGRPNLMYTDACDFISGENITVRSAAAGGTRDLLLEYSINEVDTDSNEISTAPAARLGNNDALYVPSTTIGGLASGSVYYVVNKTGPEFQLASTAGGTAINLTSSGTATLREVYVSTNVNAGTDTITVDRSHPWQNDMPLTYRNIGGTAIGGLTDGTTYYVQNRTSTTFELASSIGGSSINLTGAGTGTHIFEGKRNTPYYKSWAVVGGKGVFWDNCRFIEFASNAVEALDYDAGLTALNSSVTSSAYLNGQDAEKVFIEGGLASTSGPVVTNFVGTDGSAITDIRVRDVANTNEFTNPIETNLYIDATSSGQRALIESEELEQSYNRKYQFNLPDTSSGTEPFSIISRGGADSIPQFLLSQQSGTTDAFMSIEIDGSQAYSIGIDNNASDAFCINAGTGISTGTAALQISSGGVTTISDLVAKKLSLDDQNPELTIASGAITVSDSYHTVDTEGDAASDDLDTINGGSAGDLVVLRAADNARTVVLKHATGNLRLDGAADKTLDAANDVIMLIRLTGTWNQIAFSNNT